MVAFFQYLRDRYKRLATLIQEQQAEAGTVYLRDKGPICYTALVFTSPLPGANLPQVLLSSDIGWLWESSRRDPDDKSYTSPDLPSVRPLTHLTSLTANDFLEDLREHNADDYGRLVNLYGVDQDMIEPLVDSVSLKAALKSFVANEVGPVRVVIIQVSDMQYEYVFVPHQPIPAVNKLLEMWEITPNTKRKIRPYAKLYSAKLETLL